MSRSGAVFGQPGVQPSCRAREDRLPGLCREYGEDVLGRTQQLGQRLFCGGAVGAPGDPFGTEGGYDGFEEVGRRVPGVVQPLRMAVGGSQEQARVLGEFGDVGTGAGGRGGDVRVADVVEEDPDMRARATAQRFCMPPESSRG